MENENEENLTAKDVVIIAGITLAVTYCAVKIASKADDFLLAKGLRRLENKRRNYNK